MNKACCVWHKCFFQHGSCPRKHRSLYTNIQWNLIHTHTQHTHIERESEAESEPEMKCDTKGANHPSVGTMITTKQSVNLPPTPRLPLSLCFCVRAYQHFLYWYLHFQFVARQDLKTVDADECNNNDANKDERKETKWQLLCCVSTSCFVCLKFNEWEMCVRVFARKKRIISLAALSIFLQCFNLIWNGKWLWMVMRVSVKVNVNVNEYIWRCVCAWVRAFRRLLFALTQSVICSMWRRWWWWWQWFFTHHFPAHSERLPFTMHKMLRAGWRCRARECVRVSL